MISKKPHDFSKAVKMLGDSVDDFRKCLRAEFEPGGFLGTDDERWSRLENQAIELSHELDALVRKAKTLAKEKSK